MRKRFFIVLLVFVMFAASALCEERTKQTWHTSDYFSTVSSLLLYTTDDQSARFHDTTAAVAGIMSDVENAVSLSIEGSDIARFNLLACGESCKVSEITAEIFQIALEVYQETDGLFDPTVFPLVDLWGFSPCFHRNTYRPTAPYDRGFVDGQLPLPDPAHIAAMLPLVNLSGIELFAEEGRWYLRKNIAPVWINGEPVEAQMDLGGIAKGYVCDAVRDYLLEQGYDMGYFTCGDSSIAALSYPSDDGLLTLSLGKPRSGASPEASG